MTDFFFMVLILIVGTYKMEGENSSVSITNWNRVRLLGRGSYGVVYLATPIAGPFRLVALKVALMERSSSLVTEKRILQNFTDCPEIVQYIGSDLSFVGESFDSIFYNLVLEYAAGGNLADLIKRRGKLPENEVKEYLKMILRGLARIHGLGFVHSDLKPGNILVFPETNGKVKLKIADFGLSKKREQVIECCNFTPKFRGTPKYMSPESVVFGKIDAPMDIWSLGCILVEMISGKPVWSDCKNRRQLMKKLVYEMEIPEVPEELSREGRDFLAGCLDQNSERRWTAEMLLDHPYLEEERKVEMPALILNLPDSSLGSTVLRELLLEEEEDFGRCFEENCEEERLSTDMFPDLYFSQENKSAIAKNNEEEEEFRRKLICDVLPEDLH